MNGLLKILCLLAFVSVLFGALAASSPDAGRSGEQIVTTVCNRCHTHERICTNLGQGVEFWKATVTRMRTVNGAPVESSEVPAVATYLFGLPAGSKPVCE